jgi:GTP cyclohydrolase II
MVSQPSSPKPQPVVLTCRPARHRPAAIPLQWGAADPLQRGAIVGTVTNLAHRNVVGTHSGSYTVYRALAVAKGQLSSDHRADLTHTDPILALGPHPAWFDPDRIVSLDPFGAVVQAVYAPLYAQGYDIRPTIAVTTAHMNMPEIQAAIAQGELQADGQILKPDGDLSVAKVAIEPVWYLPGIAKRLGVTENRLRRTLYEQMGGMFSDLVNRPDLKVFLPPIGGITVYIVGDPAAITDPTKPVAVRIHDECNGSDVFGSDICTCRPYLVHGIAACIKTAQVGGVGIIVYLRKEGRALGEVTKFLVYNARKRQVGGDRPDAYFARTECVAGVQDIRFQELMPDVLHWLGITHIDRLISMSDLKYNAIIQSGITIDHRVPLPDDLIPAAARVEIAAKKAAGYYSEDDVMVDAEGAGVG